MLLWLVSGTGFVGCVIAWHAWQRITWEEAATLFVSSAILFGIQLHFIYDKATTDHELISGYVTSLIHRPAFTYKCGKNSTCREPERWIVEQRPHPSAASRSLTRSLHSGDGREYCTGECATYYAAPYHESSCCSDKGGYYAILVDPAKFRRAALGGPSAVWRPYYNPVRISDDVVYGGESGSPVRPADMPYFKLDDYNRAHRLIAPQATTQQEERLEALNARFAASKISIGLIVTSDTMYFEKLKRAWRLGKANDFVAVVYSPDGQKISNVNVLAWNNFALQENIAGAISALPSVDIDAMLNAIEKTVDAGPAFAVADFSHYRFVDVKIPEAYYAGIFLFEGLFFAYMLTLMYYNPNTKDSKLAWQQVKKMWKKGFIPPDKSWYLHPFTPSGCVLYVVLPNGAMLLAAQLF